MSSPRVLFAALAALVPALAGATNVQGTLASDTTWDPSGNPWTIVGDVTVPAGVTLTLLPGANVVFASGDTMASGSSTSRTELIVNGTLSATGSSSTGITVNAASGYGVVVNGSATMGFVTLTGGTSYYGIRSSGTLSASSTTLTGGSTCLSVENGTASFSDGTIKNCSTGAYASGGTMNLSYSVLTGNGQGAQLSAASTLDHNTVTANSGYGVSVSSFSGTVTLTNNIISGNSGTYGVYFSSSVSPNRIFHHNDIWGHSTNWSSSASPGAGTLSSNPLFVSASNLRLTENSPARFGGSDGLDLGALAYTGDPTPLLTGVLWTNRTLTGANTVTGDLTVASRVTLTLQPGATLTFGTGDVMGSGNSTSRTELIVNGTLSASGTAANGITVDAANGYGLVINGSATLDYVALTGGTSYYGIRSAGTLTATSSTISGGSTCLSVEGGTATFNSGVIKNCSTGAYASGGAMNLAYDVLTGNGTGVQVSAGAVLDHNTLTGNSGYGISVASFSGSVTLTNNIISANSGTYGVYFSSSVSPSRIFHHNDIWGHSTNWSSSASPGSGTLSANPLFVSATNFRLTENSPARNGAADASDLGALGYLGDPTPSLMGVLWTDKTLTGANTVTGDLTVATGVTLTLQPGATLTFSTGDVVGSGNSTTRTELIVDGTLAVNGTSSSPVTVNAANGYGVVVTGTATFDYTTVTGGTSYYGIRSAGTTSANNTTLSGGSTCLSVEGGTTNFNSGVIQNCSTGAYASGGSMNLAYDVLTGNGTGVQFNSGGSLDHITITGNSGYGVSVSSFSGNVTLTNNIISGNSGTYGVYFSSSVSPGRVVHHNDIWGHSTNWSSGVTPGAGTISSNPLFVSTTNYRLTENSPARMGASDGTDMGALAYTGDPTPLLTGVLWSSRSLAGANMVNGDLTVPAGVTLTLQPGATLTFGSGDVMGSGNSTSRTELIVSGTLSAAGTAASPITISATSGYGVIVAGAATLDFVTVQGGTSYYGIRSQGTLTATNSTIDGGSTCLSVESGTATFDAGTLKNCSTGAYAAGGTLNMAYTLVKANGTGVQLSSSGTLRHDTITENSGYGISVGSFTGSVSIFDTIVSSNSGTYGVYFSSSVSPSRTFHHNDVWGHSTNLSSSISPGTGTISANPLFVSPGYNYTLQATSPCRSVASDGTDIGAFAYVPVAVDHITVTPASANVATNATQQFTATAYDAANNPLPNTTFTWSATPAAGTVNTSGLFTAGCTTGTYTGAVTASAQGKSGSANVTVGLGPVATVTVSPSAVTLQPNGTQQFTAQVKDACDNVRNDPVSWLVVAGGGTISTGGVFTAGSASGTFNNTVKATASGVSGFASVTVQSAAVATIDVTPLSASVGINGTQQFTATAKDASGNTIPASITWSVVNGGGAINSSGLFTAGTAAGTFNSTVKATSGNVSGYATVTVMPGALATIQVAPTSASVAVGAAQQFSATGKDSAGNTVPVTVTWSVVNGGGTINASSGVFTAGGTAGSFSNTIKATSGNISGYASVTVTAGALATLELAPTSAVLQTAATQQFTATGKDANGNTVPATITWSVVAGGGSITGAGLFTAGTTAGTFNNTVKANSGNVSAFASVTVQPGAPASLVLSPTSATLGIGGTQQFTVTGRDANNNTVPVTATWSVVAGGGTINASTGLFTAGSATGTYTNTVKATAGNLNAYASVTVQAGALASLTVAPTSASLAPNATQQFTATGKDSGGNTVPVTVTWSVINGGGTITGSGLFTAGSTAGTFNNTVKASTSQGLSAFATVSINAANVATVTVTPASATLAVHGTQQFTAEAKDSFGNVVAATPVWSVANAGAGTISTAGLFTASAVSGAYPNAVVATVNGITGSADVTLTPGALATVVVSPADASVKAGGAVQFNAQGQDADGNAVQITPVWAALNGAGTITPSGSFTATETLGVYPDSVTATANGKVGKATVTVIPGNVTTVSISPENPLVAVQGSVTFQAHAFDPFGNEIAGLTPTWSVVSGGGTIATDGVFTAGESSGTFANTIQVSLGGKTATTGVVVATDYDQDGMPDVWEVAHGLNPNDATDATLDPDADALTNVKEQQAATDPNDADSDDDGVLDGAELKPTEDTDGDGLANALDADSDGDGTADGTEMAVATAHKDTDLSKGLFVADADPATSTDPLNKNTDGDARDDGVEDANHNGRIDDGETDPNTPETFCDTDAQCGGEGVCKAGVCAAKSGGDVNAQSGCGCSAQGSSGSALFAAVLLLLAASWAGRRRRAVSGAQDGER